MHAHSHRLGTVSKIPFYYLNYSLKFSFKDFYFLQILHWEKWCLFVYVCKLVSSLFSCHSSKDFVLFCFSLTFSASSSSASCTIYTDHILLSKIVSQKFNVFSSRFVMFHLRVSHAFICKFGCVWCLTNLKFKSFVNYFVSFCFISSSSLSASP